MAPTSKLLKLPDRGRLLIAADLHGNLRDFLAIAAMFERMQDADPESYLLFLGDLLHGPYLPLDDWKTPEREPPRVALRGRPYRDQSPALLLGFSELLQRYPGRVFSLLGNHEHAHIGGPRTSLFARDEATALEQRLGVEASLWLAGLLKGLPLWAVGACGLLFSHAAPALDPLADPRNTRLASLELIDYRRYTPPLRDGRLIKGGRGGESADPAARLLGQLLWAESMPPAQAQRLLASIGARIAVYGHAVIPAGYQTIGDEQLILSTSFGMDDANKLLLFIDLGAHYHSVSDLRPGAELVPLYP